MKYRSRPAEIEAMRWNGERDDYIEPGNSASAVIAWVHSEGGEARYTHNRMSDGRGGYSGAIDIRTINGWAYAAPGHYVVMGEASWNQGPPTMRVVRDFYPCDPKTFEKRWEPVP